MRRRAQAAVLASVSAAALAGVGASGRAMAQSATQIAPPLVAPAPPPVSAPSPSMGSGTPAPPQTPMVAVPAASRPYLGPADNPHGGSAFRPLLPPGTPQEEADAAAGPVSDLTTALNRAYWTNPQLLSERARTRSVEWRIPQARGQYGPQLEYSASYGYQRDNFEIFPGLWRANGGWTRTASAVLRQPLFTFGRLRASEDTARASAAYAEASLRATEQQTMLQAIDAYASVLRDRIGVSVAADNADLLAGQSRDTEVRLSQHESTASDAQQVAARFELAQAQLLAARSSAAASEAAFLRFVGAQPAQLQPPSPLGMPVRSLEDAYVYAADHNPVLAAAQARERISRGQVAAAKADLLPRVDLTGQASYGTALPYTSGLNQTELRGGVTISGVIDTGVRSARIAEAEEANDADWRLIDEALRENRQELASAWNEWQAQDAAIIRLANAVASAQAAFQGALEQQRAGLRTTLDMLELARDLLQVRSSYNASSAAAYVAQARVLAAMGSLDRAYLVEDARRYDAAANLRRAYWSADIPLLTPLLRQIDSVTSGPRALRPIRDPAATTAVGTSLGRQRPAP